MSNSLMYTNTSSVRSALDIDALLTANRESKPFRTCYQCRNSHFVPDTTEGKRLVCKTPRHRAVDIHPSDLVAVCPFAERHTNADVLAKDVRLALSRARVRES